MSPRSRIAAAAVAAALATAPGAALAAAPAGTAAPTALAPALPLTRAPAPANGNGSWSVGPVNRSAALAARPNFALEAPPGETVRDAVRITNLTAAPITFRLYGADAYNTPR